MSISCHTLTTVPVPAFYPGLIPTPSSCQRSELDEPSPVRFGLISDRTTLYHLHLHTIVNLDILEYQP